MNEVELQIELIKLYAVSCDLITCLQHYIKDIKICKTKLSVLKRQPLDMYNNKEKQGLDKYIRKNKGKKYVFFSFIAFFPFLQKKSNC